MPVSLIANIADKMSAWPRIAKALAALSAGAVMVPAMPPSCIWPTLFAGLSVFYILLSSLKRARAGFVYGWLFGFGYFACGLSWIANALLVEGNQFAWFWPFAVAGLPALLAFFTASAAALAVRFGKLTTLGGWLLFIFLTMGFEWLRGHIFTGFPWNLYGYAWAEMLPAAQLVSIGGIYWLSLLTCLWASLPGFLTVWKRRTFVKAVLFCAITVVMAGGWLYGHLRLKAHPMQLRHDVAIRLVQPNIPQEDKWDPKKSAQNLDRLLLLSDARRVNDLVTTIIVWPETAISDYLLQDTAASAAIKAVLSGYESPVYLLSGAMRYEKLADGSKKYFNSLMLFDNRLNPLAAYDKSHLVPFGEYIPFQKHIPLKPFVKFSGFEQGGGPQSISIPGIAGAFSPLVCYEIIFPGAVTDRKDRPGFIVNVTNDSWYGDSAGPHQHFAKTQFRAIEEGVPVVRSANTGISGVIGPLGRIVHKENLFTEGGNNVALPQNISPAPLYARFGDIIFLVSMGTILALSLLLQRVARNKEIHEK